MAVVWQYTSDILILLCIYKKADLFCQQQLIPGVPSSLLTGTAFTGTAFSAARLLTGTAFTGTAYNSTSQHFIFYSEISVCTILQHYMGAAPVCGMLNNEPLQNGLVKPFFQL